jgi:hypothetical protein
MGNEDQQQAGAIPQSDFPDRLALDRLCPNPTSRAKRLLAEVNPQ